MKTKLILSLALLSFMGTLPLRAFEAPSNETIRKMLANPEMVTTVFKGASAEEAATTLAEVIKQIKASTLNDAQKTYNIAYFTVRVLKQLPLKDKLEFAETLLKATPAEDRLILLSSLSVGGRGDKEFFNALLGLTEDGNYDETQAVKFPQIPLTGPVYALLNTTLSGEVTFPPVVALYSGQKGL